MAKVVKSKVSILTCGILFKDTFKILDHWGTIADELLTHPDFGADYFPEISHHYTVQRALVNSQTGNRLELTSSNIIYRHALDTDKEFDKQFNEYCDRIRNVIVPKIIVAYNIVTRRIGMVYSCKLDEKEIETFSAQYFKPGVPITDFRFSKKDAINKSLVFSKDNNYINKIFNVGKIDSVPGITYDYQLHYSPIQPEIRGDINVFFKNSLVSFKEDVLDKI